MKVASLVRVTLGLRNHRVRRVVHEGGRLIVDLDLVRRRRPACSGCGTASRVRDRLPVRNWRHVPCWGIPCELRYRAARVSCQSCLAVKVEAIPWSAGKSPIAAPLAVVLATWSRLLAWETVARLFGVSWSTVVAAVDMAVSHGLAERDLSGLRFIGIDELSRRKGHIYHTNVYDLSTRRLLWSAEGRGKDTIAAFFDWLGAERTAALEGICCDMWANYIKVCGERAPGAVLVFDKFHIVSHLLNAVNDVRKMEAKLLRDSDPDLLKGTRYIFLKNPGNLTKRQRRRLSELECWNLKTLRAYMLKELFKHLWQYRSKTWATRFLTQWFWRATHSGLKPLRDFAWMLRRHEAGILAYFDHRLDNGSVEAMNNNAKAIAHRARGYRTAKAFRLSMLHCMGGLNLPQTVHKFS